MKRVLITGHRGFVGRHFHERMLAEGHAVFTCDIADPMDPMDCEEGFRADGWPDMDLVIHCAATIPPIDQREKNDLIVARDLAIDASLMQWALRNQPGQVVVFSSSAAYPFELQRQEHYLAEHEVDLSDFRRPDAMYGFTKLAVELQAAEARKQGIDVRVFRPFSGYGSDQSLDYPFPAFVERARSRKAVFDIWGSGQQVRDFIHVDDIVEAVLTSIAEVDPGPLNLGTGRATTLREFAELCAAAVPGYRPAFRVHGDKPEGAYFRCADPKRLIHLGHGPKISLEEGIARAIEENRHG